MDLIGINYHAILPETVTAVVGVILMLIDAFWPGRSRKVVGLVTLGGIVAAAAAVVSLWGHDGQTSFSGMIVTDGFRLSFAMIFLIVAFLVVLISMNWLDEESLPAAEFFVLLMFATTGMLLMSAANDLVMVFLGLEITSIATYVMCAYRRRDPRANESALKYFILGSFSTAFLLYGIALIYGASYDATLQPVATTNLQLLRERIASGATGFPPEMMLAGAALMIVGFGFKVATAPFHVWSPDVYEGAPTPVTAFLSTGSKAAAFAAFARIFVLTFAATTVAHGAAGNAFSELHTAATTVLAVMAMLSMTIGNLVAIVQTNIKRMLAYSSIAHAGYALVGLAAGDWRSVAFYMLGYVVINIGALAIVLVLARRGDKRTEISDYSGIGFQSPGLTTALSLFLLSLAGIPLTAGFMGKLLVFKSAWAAGGNTGRSIFYYLVIVGVINSAISWYYYLRIIVVMFFSEPAVGFKRPAVAAPIAAALVLTILGTLYLGILPDPVLNALSRAREQISAVAK